jgi:hypothetical protein
MPAAKAPVKKKPGPKAKPKATPAPIAAPKAAKGAAIVRRKAEAQEKNFAKLRAKAASIGNSTGSVAKAIALKKDDRHLTEMQMMFVRHWAAGESILSASARAGYNDNGTYGYRLAKDPAVIKIYEREKKLYEASCQMTRKRVMEGFLDAAEMARIQADPTAMVGAWREVGKMCGYYEPVKKVIDINVNGQITQKIERMDDETLLKIIKGEIAGDVLELDLNEVDENGEVIG